MGISGIAGQMIRKALALAGILTSAVIGSLVLDLQQMVSPALVSGPCEEPTSQWMAGSPKGWCVWESALDEQDDASAGGKPNVIVRIGVKEHNRPLQATVAVTLPADGPVSDAIRRGEAVHDPSDFVSQVAGGIDLGGTYVVWGPPTMSPGDDGHTVVTTTGSPDSSGRAGLRTADPVKVGIRPARYPVDLTVTASERVVVASHVPRAGAKLDKGKLTARLPGEGRLWTVTLGSAQPTTEFITEAWPVAPTWWQRAEPVARAVLKGWGEFADLLLGTLPWILLLLAAHTGAFGSVMGRRPE